VVARRRRIAGLEAGLADEEIAAFVGEQLHGALAAAFGGELAQIGLAQVAAAHIEGDVEDIGDHRDALAARFGGLRRGIAGVGARRLAVGLILGLFGGRLDRCGRGVLGLGFGLAFLGWGRCRAGAIIRLPGLPDEHQKQDERAVEE